MENHKRKSGKRRKRNIRGRLKTAIIGILLLCIAYQGLRSANHIGYGVSRSLDQIIAGGGQNASSPSKAKNHFSPEEGYPDSLIELAENNPETIEFVKNYPNKKDSQEKIDISGDVTKGIPLFLQWDERWGYRQYGGDFMALNGCGPTCISMVWCGLTGKSKWNPYKVAQMAEEKGYYVKGAGTSWELMSSGAEALGLSVENLSLDETRITDRLQSGDPIICVVGPGDFTTQGHFLVLIGVDSDGKIILHDPNSRKRSEKRWDLENLMSQIRNLWAYHL